MNCPKDLDVVVTNAQAVQAANDWALQAISLAPRTGGFCDFSRSTNFNHACPLHLPAATPCLQIQHAPSGRCWAVAGDSTCQSAASTPRPRRVASRRRREMVCRGSPEGLACLAAWMGTGEEIEAFVVVVVLHPCRTGGHSEQKRKLR